MKKIILFIFLSFSYLLCEGQSFPTRISNNIALNDSRITNKTSGASIHPYDVGYTIDSAFNLMNYLYSTISSGTNLDGVLAIGDTSHNHNIYITSGISGIALSQYGYLGMQTYSSGVLQSEFGFYSSTPEFILKDRYSSFYTIISAGVLGANNRLYLPSGTNDTFALKGDISNNTLLINGNTPISSLIWGTTNVNGTVEYINGKRIDSTVINGKFLYANISGSSSGLSYFGQHVNDTSTLSGNTTLEAYKMLLTDNGTNSGGHFLSVWQKRGSNDSASIDTSAAAHFSKVSVTGNFIGNVPVSDLNGGSGASSSTYWRGDGTWATMSAMGVTSVSVTYGIGLNGSVTNPTTTPAITVSMVPTGVSVGSIGSSSLTLTGYINAQGQWTTCATTPISIPTSAINNQQTTLWGTTGNTLTSGGIIGSTSNFGYTFIANNTTFGSLSSSGQWQYLNDNTDENVAVFGNQLSGSVQTQHIFIGVGKGTITSNNFPYVGFGSGTVTPTQIFSSLGFSGFSNFGFFNTNTSATNIGGASPTTGGLELSFGSRLFTGGVAAILNTSGDLRVIGGGVCNSTTGLWSPPSGNATYSIFSDEAIYTPTVGATGLMATVTNFKATIGTTATNYRFLYSNNSIGWQGYFSGTAPSYFNGNTLFKTTTDNGSDAVQINGSLLVGVEKSNAAQTVVSASTSGSATFSQPEQGTSYKECIIYLNAALGIASYTFPTAFTNTPAILTTNEVASSVITTLTTTSVTITGATTTGFLIIKGY